MSWYYAVGQEQKGPVTEEQLQALASTGQINGETLVWREGMADWLPYSSVSGAGGPPVNPATAPVPAAGVVCAECSRTFSADEVVKFGDRYVCAACKPVFVQRMQEGVVPSTTLDYASFGTRFGAKVLDGLILWVVNTGVAFMLGVGMGASKGNPTAAMGLLAVTVVIQIFINAAYGTFFLGRFGATPGKMACKIKVVRPDGSRLTYGRACGRVFAEILSGMTCYIGYIMANYDEEKRSLHDRICDTRVIKAG